MMWIVASSLSLLTVSAGMALNAKAKKEELGGLFRWSSKLIILFGLLGFCCAISQGICRMGCKRECMEMRIEKCGPGGEMGGECGHGMMGRECGHGMMGGECGEKGMEGGCGDHDKMGGKECCKGGMHEMGEMKCDIKRCMTMSKEECKAYCDSMKCSPEEREMCQKHCKDGASSCMAGCKHGCKTKEECMKSCGAECGDKHK